MAFPQLQAYECCRLLNDSDLIASNSNLGTNFRMASCSSRELAAFHPWPRCKDAVLFAERERNLCIARSQQSSHFLLTLTNAGMVAMQVCWLYTHRLFHQIHSQLINFVLTLLKKE